MFGRCLPPADPASCCGFLQGDTNIPLPEENGVSIWDEWADADGELGPVYGKQWRRWETADGRSVDQIARVVRASGATPDCAAIVSAWNPGEVDAMALPPATRSSSSTSPAVALSCQLYQRSADIFTRRALQHRLLCPAHPDGGAGVRLEAGDFVWTGGDCHLYKSPGAGPAAAPGEPRALPTPARINPDVKDLPFTIDDFTLEGYDPHPHIKAPVAV